jgi:hypothetical protein
LVDAAALSIRPVAPEAPALPLPRQPARKSLSAFVHPTPRKETTP